VKRSDVFPGKYLKADDLGGREHIVTIDHVAVVAVGSGEHKQTKPVCYFAGDRMKPMVVNSTKWDAIQFIAGSDDSDDWAGLTIALVTGTTMFQGRRVNCVEVRAPKRKPAQQDPDFDETEEAPPF
jgi:hypothetical protein